MAIQFVENFYLYGQPGTPLSDANSNFNTQWITGGTGAALITTGFHAKANALTLPRTGSTYAQVERRYTTTEDVVTIGWAFRATQRGATTFTIKGADVDLLELEWPNGFQIGAEVSTTTILLNKVYYCELQITKSTGVASLVVNNYPYFTDIQAVTPAALPDTIQCVWGYPEAATPAADYVFSDIYIGDSSAGKYVDFAGPQQFTTRLITDAVEPGWAAEPDTKTRVEVMNNIPANASEYTEADTVGQADMYTSNEAVDPAATVTVVAVTSLLTKTDIDDQYVALQLDNDGTTKLGDDIPVPIQPAYFQQVFETDVADADWVPATVEATAFGPIIRPRP